MGLREVLSKMKLVEIEPSSEPPEIPSMSILPGGGPLGIPSGPLSKPPSKGDPTDIRDLLGSIPEAKPIDETKLEAETEGTDEIPDFVAIYKAAGVSEPAHGYTCYKVLEIFASPGFSALDTRAKAAALTGFLNMNPTGPVPITDVVQDAVQRDQALDRFEEFLKSKLAARTEQIGKDNAALQAEIDEVIRRNREKMETNRIALETEEARLARWQVIKRAEERKLFDAVNPFVEANPISTADAPRPAAAAPAPPREDNE